MPTSKPVASIIVRGWGGACLTELPDDSKPPKRLAPWST